MSQQAVTNQPTSSATATDLHCTLNLCRRAVAFLNQGETATNHQALPCIILQGRKLLLASGRQWILKFLHKPFCELLACTFHDEEGLLVLQK